jgi:hypothetical protein
MDLAATEKRVRRARGLSLAQSSEEARRPSGGPELAWRLHQVA